MEFQFDEDQRLLQKTVRDFLSVECTPEFVRGLWETPTGRSSELWSKLAKIGIPALLVGEEFTGLGLSELDSTLVFVEIGRAALAEPLTSTAAVAAPLLRDVNNEVIRESEFINADFQPLASSWLSKVASGDAIIAVAQPTTPLVADAHVADLLILRKDDSLYAVPKADVRMTSQPSNDPSQKLFTIDFEPSDEQRIASGTTADRLERAAMDRGALASAAQQIGACEQLIAMSVEYTSQRKQFGVPVGSFQAVKHQVANVKVALEYARSHVDRAAYSVAEATKTRSVDVSMAKISAGEAALTAARTALQVHGALGYTWEQDLHLWMRRAWTLDLAWGETAWHRARLAGALFEGTLPTETFGFSAKAA